MYCCYILLSIYGDIFYVGKSLLERIDNRKNEHTYQAKKYKRKTHKDNKIRKLNYEYSILPIKFYKTEEEAYLDEPNVINFYKSLGHKLCNLTDGGEGLRNPSLETRKKMALNGYKRFSGDGNPSKKADVKIKRSNFFKKNNPMFSEKIKEKAINNIKRSCCKPIVQMNKSFKIIGIFEGIREASKKTATDRSAIIRCCKGRQQTAGGFRWKYQDALSA